MVSVLLRALLLSHCRFGSSSPTADIRSIPEFFFGSYLLVVLFAGILIDRSDRKTMMLMYDFLSFTALSVLLVLQTMGLLEVWHLYVAAVFQGVGSAFQAPSYAAAITTMVSRQQYIRANSLMSLLYDIGNIRSVLAGSPI
jgi:MFS family permease